MLRNALFATAFREPNADVGVVINGVFAEVEGVHFDPELGCIVLELDEEALAKAIGRSAGGNNPMDAPVDKRGIRAPDDLVTEPEPPGKSADHPEFDPPAARSS